MAINPTPLIPKPKKKTNPMLLMIGAAMFLGLSAAFGIFSYLNKTQQEVKELTVTRAVVVAASRRSRMRRSSERPPAASHQTARRALSRQ